MVHRLHAWRAARLSNCIASMVQRSRDESGSLTTADRLHISLSNIVQYIDSRGFRLLRT